MSKYAVVTVLGTRPEIIRLSRVLPKLDQAFDHKVVHTGQNYDANLSSIFFETMGLREPDVYLDAAGSNGIKTMANILSSFDDYLAMNRVDAVLVLGDTNSAISILSAKKRKIPTFHMEAGNRCFDLRVPEEVNRRLVDHVSDVNLPYSQIAQSHLLSEGLPKDLVLRTGSPMKEVLSHYQGEIDGSSVLADNGLEPCKYILISAHREENIEPDNAFEKLCQLLKGVQRRYQVPVLVSTHPRTRKRLESYSGDFHGDIIFHEPFDFFSYNKLQKHALVVLSDSGTISEESAIQKFPAVNIRETHERHEAMEAGVVPMSGLDWSAVVSAIDLSISRHRGSEQEIPSIPADYDVDDVSLRVVNILQSYIPYVRRVCWGIHTT